MTDPDNDSESKKETGREDKKFFSLVLKTIKENLEEKLDPAQNYGEKLPDLTDVDPIEAEELNFSYPETGQLNKGEAETHPVSLLPEEAQKLCAPSSFMAYLQKYHEEELYKYPSLAGRKNLTSERLQLWNFFFPVDMGSNRIESHKKAALEKFKNISQQQLKQSEKEISRLTDEIKKLVKRNHQYDEIIAGAKVKEEETSRALERIGKVQDSLNLITERQNGLDDLRRQHAELGPPLIRIVEFGLSKLETSLNKHRELSTGLVQNYKTNLEPLLTDPDRVTAAAEWEEATKLFKSHLLILRVSGTLKHISPETQKAVNQLGDAIAQVEHAKPNLIKEKMALVRNKIDADAEEIQQKQQQWDRYRIFLSNPDSGAKLPDPDQVVVLEGWAKEYADKKHIELRNYKSVQKRTQTKKREASQKRNACKRNLHAAHENRQQIFDVYKRSGLLITSSFENAVEFIPEPPAPTDVKELLSEDIENIRRHCLKQTGAANHLLEISVSSLETGRVISIGNPIFLISPAELQEPGRIPNPYRPPQPEIVGDKIKKFREWGWHHVSYEFLKPETLPDEVWYLQAKRFAKDEISPIAYFGVYFIELFFILDELLILYSLFFDFIRGQIIEEKATEIYYKEVVAIEYGKEYRPITLVTPEGITTQYLNTDFISLVLPDGDVRTTTLANATYYDHISRRLGQPQIDFSEANEFAQTQTAAQHAMRVLRKYLREIKGNRH